MDDAKQNTLYTHVYMDMDVYHIYIYISGQIIATSHDLTPHGRVVGEPCLKWPYFREIQVGEIL